MRRGSTARQLSKLIQPYGLSVIDGDHRKIVNGDGQAVYWFSGSPSCGYFAENIIRDLVRQGLVPAHLKRQRLRC